MKLRFAWWWTAMACGWPTMAGAQLQLLSTPEAQQLFAGAAKTVSVTFSNPGN
jgi:hypothetical protein